MPKPSLKNKAADSGNGNAPLLKPKRRKPRVERLLKKRAPLLVENTKRALVLKGLHSSETMNGILKDVARLSKPHCHILSKKNEILPFEDVNSLEFLCQKNDCSLFALGSHSKKRPNNLVLGRLHDGHILDMIEFGVDGYVPLEDVSAVTKAVGSKPMFVFLGDEWDMELANKKAQNIIIDFFRGDKVDKISLKGLDHVIACSIVESKIYFRLYSVGFLRSGTKVPNVELDRMGPFMTLTMRRTQFASDDLMKAACRVPKAVKQVKVKNIKYTALGEKVGRIHMKKQNLDEMGGRRVNALRDASKKRLANDDEETSRGSKKTKR